jgi:hypothetical protein
MQIFIKIVNAVPPLTTVEPVRSNHATEHADVIELTGDEWARRADTLTSEAA